MYTSQIQETHIRQRAGDNLGIDFEKSIFLLNYNFAVLIDNNIPTVTTIILPDHIFSKVLSTNKNVSPNYQLLAALVSCELKCTQKYHIGKPCFGQETIVLSAYFNS